MKITARVRMPDGSPVAKAEVEVVAPGGSIAAGEVRDGDLTAEAPNPMPPVWALMVDRRPVVAFPAASDQDSVDLGEITLQPEGFPWPAFHADKKIVYGVSSAALAAPDRPPASSRPTPSVPMSAPPIPLPSIEIGRPVPVGLLFDSVAKQFSRVAPASEGMRLTGASVTVRGLPSGSGDGFSLEFPDAEMARNAAGLSELSFGLRLDAVTLVAPPPPDQRPMAPDVVGYTRELALRKLAASGLTASATDQVVTDDAAIGRVARQLPAAGAPVDAEVPVRLFVGVSAGGPDGS